MKIKNTFSSVRFFFKRSVALFFTGLILIAQQANAQWSSLGGGANDMVYAACPDVAGTGIYCCLNFGNISATKNWIQSSTGSSTPANLNANAYVNNYMYAIATSGTKIYVGGAFTTAQGAGAYGGIAVWNTATNTWSNLGTGAAGSNKTIYAIAMDPANNLMYVGGEFTSISGVAANNVAVYNFGTSTWSALGSGATGAGVTNAPAGAVAGVYALTVCNGKLYAGGRFTTMGGAAANSIACWNGAAWSTLSGGGQIGVTTTTIVNPPNIACAVWDAPVMALTNDGTTVYVGGDFNKVNNAVGCNNIAAWNTTTSTWSTLGNGMTWPALGATATDNTYGDQANIYCLTMYNGNLIAGGDFMKAGTVGGANTDLFVAQWNGTSWSAMTNTCGGHIESDVFCLTVSNNVLYAGGQFPEDVPNTPTGLWYIAKYTGAGPVMTINVGTGTTICSTSSVGLSASGATTYTWTNSTGLSCTVCSNPTASPTTTTVYTVTGTSSGCNSSKTVTVTVVATPTLTVNSPTICNGSSVVLAASSASAYSWNMGATTNTISVSPGVGTTTYTVTGDNGSGCTATKTATVTVSAQPTLSISGATSHCTGSAMILTGSTTAGTYTWSANAGSVTTSTASVNPGAGSVTYTLNGTNGACTANTTITVSVTATPTVGVNNPSICSGTSAVITATGATTYTWNTGATTNTISASPGSTTVYTVTGDNGAGCTSVKTATITVTTQPTVSISGSTTNCSASSMVLTASTNAGTYTWSANAGGGSASTVTVTPAAGNITYTLNGSNGACTNSTTITVSVTATPTVTVNNPSICSGTSAVITANGASTYTWNTGATTNTISASPGSTTVYTVTGDNGNGCTSVKTATISVTTQPTVSISGATTNCSASPMVLTASTNAGTYTWSANAGGGSASTTTVTPAAGSITYTLNGSNGACTNSTTITVSVTPTPTLTVNSPTICEGNTAILTASSATSYSWSTTATTNTISVSPGVGTTTYAVTGDNGNGCTATKTATVTVTSQPTVSISGSTAHCSGSAMTLTGSTTAGTFTWSANAGGVSTSTVSVNPGLGNTTYTLNGSAGTCTATTSITVSVTATPTLAVNNATICSGQSTVLTAATANSYSWSTTATTNTVSVSPGTTTVYTVTGDNGAGCTSTKTATVTVNPTPTVVISGAHVICEGQTITLSGATAASYTWLPGGSNGSTLSVTPPNGSHTYTLVGANGVCTATDVASVDVSPSPTLSVNSATICSGQSVVLSASGATTFSWSANAGGIISPSVTVSPTSTTVYTVGGIVGTCKDSITTTVNVSPSPTLTLPANSYTVCLGNSVTLGANGATTYTWTTGTGLSCTVCQNPVSTPTTATIYTVTGTTGSCSSMATVTVSINVNPLPTLTLTPTSTSLCSSNSSTITASGASTYTWSPAGSLSSANGSTVTATPGTTTNYTVSGTDVNGCMNTSTVSITVSPTPTVSISPVPPTACAGQSVILNGGTATTYTWSANAGSANTATVAVTPTVNTTYTLTGTTGSCTASAVATVTVYPLPSISSTSVTSAACGQSNGCINSVTATGGTPGYQYSFDGGATWSGTSSLCGLPATNYTVEVKDVNNCLASQVVSIGNLTGPSTPSVAATATAACIGDNATLSITSPVGTYTYTWTDASGTTTGTSYTITNIGPAGNYNINITATDINGCIASTSTTIVVNSLPATAVSGNTHFCKGSSAGTALTASPNGSGYTYQWSQGGTPIVGATAGTYTANAAGTYNVLITDNTTGCNASAAANYTITIDSLPAIDTTGMIIATSNCNASTGSITNVTVTPGGGTSYTWTDATGAVVGTSLNLNGVPAGNYCLHATTNPENCKDSLCSFTVNNSGAPSTPVLTTPNNTYCQGQTQNPIVVTGSVTLTWYSDPGLTTQIASGTTYTPNVAVTTTVYVTATNAGCASNALPVVITINPTPADPLVATPGYTYCQSQTVGAINATGNPIILWSTSPTMNPVINTGPTFTPSGLPVGTTTYYLQDSSSLGCKSAGTTTVSVTINATPADPTLSAAPAAYCQGQTISPITATGTGTILWYDNAGLTQVINTGSTYTPPGTVGTFTYYVVDSSAAGCKSTGTVTVSVTVNPTPSSPLVAIPSYTYCSSQTPGTITATGASTILWSTSPTMSPVINAGPTYTPSGLPVGTTTYYLQDSSAAGCKSVGTTTVTVTVNQTPVDPTLSAAPAAYCEGQTIAPITANGTGTILWYDNAGLTPVINTGSSYTPPGTVGTFTYYIVDSSAAGCKSTGTVSVTVTVNPTPAIPTVSATGTTVCSGTPVGTFTATGNPGGTILWSGSNTMNPVINTGTTFTPPNTIGTTVYYLQDSSATGCKSNGLDSIVITVNQPPTISGGVADTAKCGVLNGGISSLTVTPVGTYTYTWTDQSTGAVVGNSLDLIGVGAGNYSLTVTDVNGCIATGASPSYSVPTVAAPSVTITPTFTQGTSPVSVTFTSSVSPDVTIYTWDLGNGTTSTLPGPSATYTAVGTYSVVLTVSNGTCANRDTATVIVDSEVSILIPNIYSPNGDGINDEFFITCVGIEKLHCDIFNRWGQLVYQLFAVDQKWDGVMINGNDATDGTYFYILDATGYDGKKYNSKGSLTLVR